MRSLLLDTHVLLWLLGEPDKLAAGLRDEIADPGVTVFVSIGSLWEIVLKRRVGKLDVDVDAIAAQMHPNSKLRWLPITQEHLRALDRLPVNNRHRNPFHLLLVAQCIAEGLTLVTADRNARLYPVPVLAT